MRRLPVTARPTPTYPDFHAGRVLLGVLALAVAPLPGCDRIQALFRTEGDVAIPEPVPTPGEMPAPHETGLPSRPGAQDEADDQAPESDATQPIPEVTAPVAAPPRPDQPRIAGGIRPPREAVPAEALDEARLPQS